MSQYECSDNKFMTNNLKKVRKIKAITQAELAYAVKVTQQTIHSIENNKFIPSVYTALKIAKYFDLNVEDIFTLNIED